jgi:carboxymethylenebutenolidase
MIDRELDLETPDGTMNTFVTHPEEGGPHPTVLFYMDAPGKREELHDMARRLASAGYFVVLPNLYYRRVREFKIEPTDEWRKRMFEHMRSLSRSTVLMDTAAMLEFAQADYAAKTDRVGAVGYCMSGPFVFWAAAEYPQRIAAAASFHGVSLCTDSAESPHRFLDRIRAELYVGCAETDSYAPQEMVDALAGHLRNSPARSRIEWYPQTHHGFVFPQRTAAYHKASAERHWERMHALFARNVY